ncbi:KUP/HAK/KT family potassium transporter [Turneriella parva]|uniref:Probable potassium transport system protein Kup n=1 Tax=Turneriella parva (strain ATCC BAA-1111 / DSM 21527 / NCTC 11395 / H) TaxID=869212 RepID=I4B7V2_TURPD|nr:KUP/HAK/KT family potassium transporter [Turneriella parva]AFM13359.1 Low affinity potassium transport system protein kup [Turneriella parva DSM 21527]
MQNSGSHHRISFGGLIVALGIIYGDIGTSPLYVFSAIAGTRVLSEELILGGLSCIFWTLTLVTTLKYVTVTLRADNHGEGGIFSLFTLVRRRSRWLIVPAVVGGCALLADGMITPPISVSSAVEGLEALVPGIPTVKIVVVILTALFVFQQFGTNIVGRWFGPIMLVWFGMIAVLGLGQLVHNPWVLKAANPWYAYHLLAEYPQGYWILGAVFLCTTGAEALYTDLGHCGLKNIRSSWAFVKLALLLNYAGQAAFLLSISGQSLDINGRTQGGLTPFYSLMPSWFLPVGILVATIATVIASQAIISGAFTLIAEAIRLNLWPKVRIKYPSNLKGQIYVPSANRLLWFGCIAVTLWFGRAANMEAAYGMAITFDMMMTTILLTVFLAVRAKTFLVPMTAFFGFISVEIAFLIANLEKFSHGGWVTLVIGSAIFFIMWSWYAARKIRNRLVEFVPLSDYFDILHELSYDTSVPKYATNLVYLTSANNPTEIEWKVIYSLFFKQPKRADVYWFVHVDVTDEPYTMAYKVDVLVPNDVIRIEFKLGFRVEPRINQFFRKAVSALVEEGIVDITSRYASLNQKNILGDFRFIIFDRVLSHDNQLNVYERVVTTFYKMLKLLCPTEEKAFGLDTSIVEIERVPLIVSKPREFQLERLT